MTLMAFIMHIAYASSHVFLNKGIYFTFGDFAGLAGIVGALVLLNRGNTQVAGISILVGISATIFINNVIGDRIAEGPLDFTRLYISTTEMLLLGYVSILYINKREAFLLFGLWCIILLTAHFVALLGNPHAYSANQFYPYFYYIGLLSIIVGAFISGFFALGYIQEMLNSNENYAQKIASANEELESKVSERTRELKAINKSLEEFAYAVSHDLKEPLRTMSGYFSLTKRVLKAKGVQDEEVELFLNQGIKSAQRMDNLIQDILAFSKLSTHDRHAVPVDLNKVVETVLDRLAKTIEDTSTKIEVEKLPVVMGEDVLLTQLYQNLVSNAIKYRSPSEAPVLKIGVVTHSNNVQHFYVKDNGIGIAPKYFDSIFKIFQRLHSTENDFEGNGVGLAMCKKIVEMHSGKIWVDSAEGNGSTFSFTIENGTKPDTRG
jgi:signal transduction histidine kinase